MGHASMSCRLVFDLSSGHNIRIAHLNYSIPAKEIVRDAILFRFVPLATRSVLG